MTVGRVLVFIWCFIGPFSSYRYECYTLSSFFQFNRCGRCLSFLDTYIFSVFFRFDLISIDFAMYGPFYHLTLSSLFC